MQKIIRRVMPRLGGSWALGIGAVAFGALVSVNATAFELDQSCKAGASGWAEIVSEANSEGQLLMYSTRSDADNTKLLAGFMEKYPGIKAQAIRLVGNKMNERINQELKAGVPTADLLVFSDQIWMAEKLKEGALEKPCGPSAALWAGAGKLYPNPELVPIANEPWVMAYNTNLVKPAPRDWGDLINRDEFVGRVGLNEVSGLTVAIWAETIDRLAGGGYFAKLAKLKPRIYPNSAPLTQGMAAGEIAWAPYSLASTIEPLKAKGAPIEWLIPNGGTFLLQRNAIMLKVAPHPAAGMLLFDYAMSAEGQGLINGSKRGVAVAPGIQLEDDLDVDLNKIHVVDSKPYGADTVTKWRSNWDSFYR